MDYEKLVMDHKSKACVIIKDENVMMIASARLGFFIPQGSEILCCVARQYADTVTNKIHCRESGSDDDPEQPVRYTKSVTKSP